ncbi:TetR family transcriptional regulator [Corynebacterium sphenisci DSM 44792]|uniref:TetR family transcriptional regulator n=1 Tax=Corynebacterium sphenisci DSM 44792 TaxID=1437874 RepID=A0A1L7CWA7_9CORY|nr:TetR family transcriptional regulator [Corynebacterium sphenisci]APT90133.1 TetR family transcriptional regulator [Corynebacterium sphenisci DSM 44792]
MGTRAEQRTRRHAEIIAAAAGIIAERGFRGTRLEDVGAAVGISGPGLYRYVGGKEELLAQILVDVSVRLVDGARAVLAEAARAGWDDGRTLRELLAHHVEFAVSEPDRIRVQEREIGHLAPGPREKVRSLQRTYLEMWVEVLRRVRPDLDARTARVRTQLIAGLINSSRHIIRREGPELVRAQAMALALAVIDAG